MEPSRLPHIGEPNYSETAALPILNSLVLPPAPFNDCLAMTPSDNKFVECTDAVISGPLSEVSHFGAVYLCALVVNDAYRASKQIAGQLSDELRTSYHSYVPKSVRISIGYSSNSRLSVRDAKKWNDRIKRLSETLSEQYYKGENVLGLYWITTAALKAIVATLAAASGDISKVFTLAAESIGNASCGKILVSPKHSVQALTTDTLVAYVAAAVVPAIEKVRVVSPKGSNKPIPRKSFTSNQITIIDPNQTSVLTEKTTAEEWTAVKSSAPASHDLDKDKEHAAVLNELPSKERELLCNRLAKLNRSLLKLQELLPPQATHSPLSERRAQIISQYESQRKKEMFWRKVFRLTSVFDIYGITYNRRSLRELQNVAQGHHVIPTIPPPRIADTIKMLVTLQIEEVNREIASVNADLCKVS